MDPQLKVPMPRSDPTGLHSRVRALESTLQRAETIKPSFLETFRARKEKQIEQEFSKLEDKYFTEVTTQFDLSDKKSFLSIVKFTVTYVADHALSIATLCAFPITGGLKADLAVKLLGQLFSDIAVELLEQVVEHVYTLTYTKTGDSHTIRLLESKIAEVNVGQKTSDQPQKKTRKWYRFFGSSK